MPKQTEKLLTKLGVDNAKKPGYYPDGGNLYLQVTEKGAKSWIFRYSRNGKRPEMGLGAVHAVSLADARGMAQTMRGLLASGQDPLQFKKAKQAAARIAATKGTTFETCANGYIEAHKNEWKQERHSKQWLQSLKAHAFPILAKLPVDAIDTPLIMKVLEPIWAKKTETAKRLRGRIESILDWAKVRGYRSGENPAQWRGNLDHLLASPNKLIKVKHFDALPYREVGAFFKSLDSQPGLSPKALKLVILTGLRSMELLGSKWKEVDLAAKVWTVPAERMKMGKEHRVPLSDPAIQILSQLRQETVDVEGAEIADLFVFPSMYGEKSLSNMTMLMLLKRMKRSDITVHGFRSSFRDWVAEQTDYPSEVAEAALAHAISNKVEAAYRRTDLFDKRRTMMADWAAYCQKDDKND